MTQREFEREWIEEMRIGKELAEQINDCMTPTEAFALEVAVMVFPEESLGMVEAVFDARGWPDPDASEIWLDSTGLALMKVYGIYTAIAKGTGQ